MIDPPIQAIRDRDDLPTIRQNLRNRANVWATAIGYKHTNGERTDDPCVFAYVDEKRPVAHLADSDVVPAAVNGVTTDVRELDPDDITPDDGGIDSRHSRTRPAIGSVKLARPSGNWGTLGIGVRNSSGDPAFLTNHHVVENDSGTVVSDMHQPSPDSGEADDNVFGTPTEWGETNDWALVEPDDPGWFTNELIGTGAPTALEEPGFDDRLVFNSAKTGVVGGALVAVDVAGNFSERVDYEYELDGDPDTNGGSGSVVGWFDATDFKLFALHNSSSSSDPTRKFGADMTTVRSESGLSLDNGSYTTVGNGSPAYFEGTITDTDATDGQLAAVAINAGGTSATDTVEIRDRNGVALSSDTVTLDAYDGTHVTADATDLNSHGVGFHTSGDTWENILVDGVDPDGWTRNSTYNTGSPAGGVAFARGHDALVISRSVGNDIVDWPEQHIHDDHVGDTYRTIHWPPGGTFVGVRISDSVAEVRHADGGASAISTTASTYQEASVNHDSSVVAAGDGYDIQLSTFNTGDASTTPLTTITTGDDAWRGLQFSPIEDTLAVGYRTDDTDRPAGAVVLYESTDGWNTYTEHPASPLDVTGLEDAYRIRWSPNGRYMYVSNFGAADTAIHVFDRDANYSRVNTIDTDGDGDRYTLATSPGGTWLATSEQDGDMYIWNTNIDPVDPPPAHRFTDLDDPRYQLDFSETDDWVAVRDNIAGDAVIYNTGDADTALETAVAGHASATSITTGVIGVEDAETAVAGHASATTSATTTLTRETAVGPGHASATGQATGSLATDAPEHALSGSGMGGAAGSGHLRTTPPPATDHRQRILGRGHVRTTERLTGSVTTRDATGGP